MKKQLMMALALALLSLQSPLCAGYEFTVSEEEVEHRGFINDAANTHMKEELEHRDLINDASLTSQEEDLSRRDLVNDASRTAAAERREQTQSYY